MSCLDTFFDRRDNPEVKNQSTSESTRMEESKESVSSNAQLLASEAVNKSQSDEFDPLLRKQKPSDVVQEGDFVILQFGDGRLLFAHCNSSASKRKGKGKIELSVKIQKKNYLTNKLIGLPFGTVLEQGLKQLTPLPQGSKLVPEIPPDLLVVDKDIDCSDNGEGDEAEDQKSNGIVEKKRDNRHIVDNNTAQSLNPQELRRLRESGAEGSEIVQAIIENSSTFEHKTDFSKAKYVARKQKKYQPRCRILRPNADNICQLMHMKDSRRMMNLRNDTLAQILSYANITAGCQVLVMETGTQGVLTGALAQRMGGYGNILSMYTGQQSSFTDLLQKFNLTFAENYSIKWLHAGDVFSEDPVTRDQLIGTRDIPNQHKDPKEDEEEDVEQKDRDALEWPCVLQPHTRNYLKTTPNMTESKIKEFMAKRSARFARKLTRQTPLEAKKFLLERPCDSIILAVDYNPTETLLQLLPYLAPSCPFVVYCEFMEPLTECFRTLQAIELEPEQKPIAINLRLSDTWMREYQILPGRTHPNMNMSQSGGFLLTGIKLDQVTGHNDLDPETLQQLKTQLGSRRERHGKRSKRKHNGHQTVVSKENESDGEENANKRARVN